MKNNFCTMVAGNDDENEEFWRVIGENFSNECDNTPPDWKERVHFPVYEGLIPVGSSHSMARYHICSCFDSSYSEGMYLNLVMQICKVACIIGDISHGRPISVEMQSVITKACINKLKNMWFLIDTCHENNHNNKDVIYELRSMPTIPKMIDVVLITPSRLEAVVLLHIGLEEYWASLKLQSIRGKWVCILADIG